MAALKELTVMLDEMYRKAGAYQADILYLFPDLRMFGSYAEVADRDLFCKSIVEPFLERHQTIILPTFSYTTEGVFDVLSTPTKIGAMNKWIMTQAEFRRSEHPLFSHASIGEKSCLVEGVSKSAFGKGSLFDRLHGKKAAFLHIGRPVAIGNTVIHYVEQMCGATYRFHKAFPTKVYLGEEYVGTDYTAFLRRRDVIGEDFVTEFSLATKMMYEANLVRHAGSDQDYTNISFYWYDEVIDFLADLFYKDQTFFIASDFIGY